MNENQFLNWIVALAETFGWSAWHVPAPMRAVGGDRFVPEPRAKGLPDLILMRPEPARIIFAEVKSATGETTAEQDTFLRLARAVTNALDTNLHALREVLRAAGADTSLAEVRPPIGVYLWRPGMEDLIETTLRSKVLS